MMHFMIDLPIRIKMVIITIGNISIVLGEGYPNCCLVGLNRKVEINCQYSTFRCGPLSRVWCMRFEAKHSYFKHIARVIGNFKNIPKTMALWHQHFMCYQLIGNTYLKPSPAYHGGNTQSTTKIIITLYLQANQLRWLLFLIMHYTLNLLLWNSMMILFCKGTWYCT